MLGLDEDRGLYQSAEKSQGRSYKSHVDLLTIAPTGSGKTLAFLIHVFHRLLTDLAVSKKAGASTEREHKAEALVIAPTHELADQVFNEGRKLAMGTGSKVAVMRKGMRLTAAERGADNGCIEKEFADEVQNDKQQPLVKLDIIVSTPLVLVHAILPTSNCDPTPFPRSPVNSLTKLMSCSTRYFVLRLCEYGTHASTPRFRQAFGPPPSVPQSKPLRKHSSLTVDGTLSFPPRKQRLIIYFA